jgi:hypothetical protein
MRIYRAVFVVLCAVAVALDLSDGAYVLNYYTLLSNIACLVFFAVAVFRGARPRAEAAMVYCIAITGIIYAVLLAPADFGTPRFASFSNLTLHYVAPAMVLLDWLIFAPKGKIRTTDPLRWLLMPLCYFIYILVRSTFAGDIGDTGSAFPYDFIDPAVAGGWGKMLVGVIPVAAGMAALGYLIYVVDRIWGRVKYRRRA